MWIRCMSIHSLNVILCSTGNQWGCYSPGVVNKIVLSNCSLTDISSVSLTHDEHQQQKLTSVWVMESAETLYFTTAVPAWIARAIPDCRLTSTPVLCDSHSPRRPATHRYRLSHTRKQKMSAFVTYSCFEWCMPLLNGCIDCPSSNAVLNMLSSQLIGRTNATNKILQQCHKGTSVRKKTNKQIKNHETNVTRHEVYYSCYNEWMQRCLAERLLFAR